ncbi:MAG: hypothetical protein N2578_05165 [Bdellovibrionaceae bacterium]|nr:hypothetical protein [Pseudobdellovibrionaceae bacterium]
MIFNLLKITLFVVLVFPLISCSDFLRGEGSKRDNQVELQTQKLSCLNTVPNRMHQLTTLEAEKVDIDALSDCLDNAFTEFRLKTKGSTSSGYTPENLRTFFNDYFTRKTQISPQLAREIFVLKAALVGGSEQELTKAEIQRLQSLLKDLAELLKEMRPWLTTLNFSNTKSTAEEIRASVGVLRGALINLLKKTELARSRYTFANFTTLLNELRVFIGREHETVLTLMGPVKVILFGEQANFQSERDWRSAIFTATELLEIGLLAYNRFQSGFELNEQSIDPTAELISGGLRLLGQSWQVEQQGGIPFHQIDRLIDLLEQEQVVTFPVPAAVIKSVYPRLTLKIFDPVRRGDDRGFHKIEKVHLAAMQREIHIFRLNQLMMDKGVAAGIRRGLKAEELMKSFPEAEARQMANTHEEYIALTKASYNFAKLLEGNPTLRFLPDGRFIIQYSRSPSPWSWQERALSNLFYSFTRAMLLSYGDLPSGEIYRAVLTESDLVEWYDDFKPLGIALKAFDPRSGNSGSRSFHEANNFTRTTDGNQVLTMAELWEYVSMLVVGGLISGRTLRSEIEASGCVVLGAKDVFDLPLFEEKCFSRALRSKFGVIFSNLPSFSKWVQGLNEANWNDFFRALLSTSKTDPDLRGLIEHGDIRTMVMVIHYIENLMVKFDADQNGSLNTREVRTAAPYFLPFLKSRVDVRSDTVLTEAFVYLVMKSEKPDFWSLLSYQVERFSDWMGLTGKEIADRAQMARVLQVLKSELKKPQN